MKNPCENCLTLAICINRFQQQLSNAIKHYDKDKKYTPILLVDRCYILEQYLLRDKYKQKYNKNEIYVLDLSMISKVYQLRLVYQMYRYFKGLNNENSMRRLYHITYM